MKTPKTPFLLPAALGLVLGACSSSDDGGTTPPPSGATLDGLVQDAAVDDLAAFTLQVTEVRLLDGSGGATENLLLAPATVELLGLQTSGEWLFRAQPAAGTYTGARFAFDSNSVQALALDGTDVAVTTSASTIDTTFLAPLTVGTGSYARLVLDVDLSDSLSGSVAAPPLTFSPVVDSTLPGGAEDYGIDEFDGLVRTFDATAGTVVVEAFADDAQAVSLGEVAVTVTGSTVLLDDAGLPFASSADFFQALVADASLLEVHGVLGSGAAVDAQRIEVEDHQGGAGGSANRVEIEGRVVDVSAGVSFDVLVFEVEKGASIAGPVLTNLGSPSAITVTFDGTTVFRDGDDHSVAASTDLAVGQRVDVRFADFASSFLAQRVEFEGAPDHTGTVTDVSGLPNSITIQLSPSESAIAAGLVLDSNTDVVVDISGADLVLRADDEHPLGAADLVEGIRVHVRGAVAGTPAAPTIATTRVRARSGRLRGTVSGVDAQNSSFDVTVSSVDDPFGGAATTPPFTVTFESGCTFDGDIDSEAAFFAAFAGLSNGEVLHVEVLGLGTSVANAVRAFHVEAEVD